MATRSDARGSAASLYVGSWASKLTFDDAGSRLEFYDHLGLWLMRDA